MIGSTNAASLMKRIRTCRHYFCEAETMKRSLQHFVYVTFALFIAYGIALGQDKTQSGAKGDIAELRATIEDLRAEVGVLRKAVARLELERHRNMIRQTKAELDKLRAEQARLAELDRSRKQDLHDVEELLTRGDVAPEQRTEIEGVRAELAVAQGREIDQQAEAARAREGELLHRLQTEEQFIKRLEEAWKSIGGKHDDTF